MKTTNQNHKDPLIEHLKGDQRPTPLSRRISFTRFVLVFGILIVLIGIFSITRIFGEESVTIAPVDPNNILDTYTEEVCLGLRGQKIDETGVYITFVNDETHYILNNDIGEYTHAELTDILNHKLCIDEERERIVVDVVGGQITNIKYERL